MSPRSSSEGHFGAAVLDSVSLQTGCNRQGIQAHHYVSLKNEVSPLTNAVKLVPCVMRMVPEVFTKPSVSPCGCHVGAVYTKRLVPTSRFRFETQHRARSQCFVFCAQNADNQINVAQKLEKNVELVGCKRNCSKFTVFVVCNVALPKRICAQRDL